MKQVLVETLFGQTIPYRMLSNLSDFYEYDLELNGGVEKTLQRLLRSDVDIKRWDHMIGRNDEGSMLGAAIATANVRGSNPIYEIEPLVQTKLRSIFDIVLDGGQVLINDVGGYHTLIEESEYVSIRKESYVIGVGTGYINLENDETLENRTKDYLGGLDVNYSYVCNLRDYVNNGLVDIFNEFQSNGDHTVYVYTTGIDIAQMYSYCNDIPDIQREMTDKSWDELFEDMMPVGDKIISDITLDRRSPCAKFDDYKKNISTGSTNVSGTYI